MKNTNKIVICMAAAIGALVFCVKLTTRIQKKQNVNDKKNPFEGKKVVFIEDASKPENADGMRGYLQAVGETKYEPSFYDKYVKRGIDIVLSFCGIIVLSPILLGIAIAIKIDDPGPVFFTQKRLGQNKKYFRVYKFRSMKMSTPHDTPTHMLDDPDQYITKVGKFLRAHSLDELPQLFNVLDGSLSLVGPRPGLWNQDILTAERDKYGVNEMKPGITGWAQINGRDSISIEEKAKLDGYWKEHESFLFDLKCLLGTVMKVGHDDSVVEGGTGVMEKKEMLPLPETAEISHNINFSEKKRILIAGKHSYIGQALEKYLLQYDNYEVDSFETRSDDWKEIRFCDYDVIYNVAGIAHIKETNENMKLYYDVNRDLAVEIAKKAKKEGVKEYIYLSSMSVYGLTEGRIDAHTEVNPCNAYGMSKLEAERLLWQLNDETFVVAIVRPPMVYGNGCKGNYQSLRKFAIKFGVFPEYNNERSMLYIDNLSSAIRGIIHNEMPGVYFPQNIDYIKTYDMVKTIVESNDRSFHTTKLLNPIIKFLIHKINVVKKVFGTLTYDMKMNVPNEWIIVKDNEVSIKMTEGKVEKKNNKKKALMIGSMGSMLDNFNRSNIDILSSLGYEVTLAANFKDEDSNSQEKDILFVAEMKSKGYKVVHIDFSRKVSNVKKQIKSYKQVRKLLKEDYQLVHCHSPICAAIVRILYKKYRKDGQHKVYYTAHGFHFYQGGSKKNWLFYYPIEKILSRWTDVLITINHENYDLAQKKFYAKDTRYIPGVGVDVDKFDISLEKKKQNRYAVRKELNIPEDAFVLLSVGELQNNKNQRVIIEALHELNNPHIYYMVVGKGVLIDEYRQLVRDYHLEKNVMILGFRTDIMQLGNAADCFVHPSIREGLGIAPLEAMAGGLPLISSYTYGMKDYTEEGVSGCCLKNPLSVIEMKEAIEKMYSNVEFRKQCGMNNLETVKKFDVKNTNQIMIDIYKGAIDKGY